MATDNSTTCECQPPCENISDHLVKVIDYQAGKALEDAAIETAEWLIDSIPELEDAPDDLNHLGLIKLPDGRIVDIHWKTTVSTPQDTENLSPNPLD